jgi:hypothetical protein
MRDLAGVKRWIPALGWGLCVLALALLVGGALLQEVTGHANQESTLEHVALLVGFASFPVIGSLIASRHPRNALGWIFLLVGLGVGVLLVATEYSYMAFVKEPSSYWPGATLAAWLGQWLWYPCLMAIPSLALLLFPDGRPPTQRWRWLVWATGLSIGLVSGASMFQRRLQGDGFAVDNPVGFLPFADGEQAAEPIFLAFFGVMFLSVASVVVRFRRARPEQRQQIKLLLMASVIFAVAIFLGDTFDLPEIIFPLVLWLIPGAIGVAILRYRLYDIDLVINRTLVYALLTGILVMTYLAIVFALQQVLSDATRESDMAVAASTLAVAALFRPLRTRIQLFIDRRFNRQRYDAQRTIEAFAAKLREDVDLDHLSSDLSAVVTETMQPAHVSVWLRSSSARTG